MTRAFKTRNVLFVLLGVAGLVLKGRYTGPLEEIVHSHGGNLAASFAVYFVAANLPSPEKFKRLWAAGAALAVVELFEALNGFGVMTNVYDPWDFAANAAGIVLALGWTLDVEAPPLLCSSPEESLKPGAA